MEDPMAPWDEQVDDNIRTRCGYPAKDVLRSFKAFLEQPGAEAAGKCLHYTADLISSGCLELWQKCLWDYAFDHIGIASPRIFHFLKERFDAIESAWALLPSEDFCRMIEFQRKFGECVLVIRSCIRKPPLKIPKVPAETHSDEWVRSSTGGAPPSSAVAKVFRSGSEPGVLKKVGDEIAKACSEGATEKALFWMKWLYDEEAMIRRESMGTFTPVERGPSSLNEKARRHVGFFIAALCAEIYKEMAAGQKVRMNEEYSALLKLFANPNKLLSQKRRMEILVLLIQILCEVPKWKIPAAPSLVSDPVVLERALGHVNGFFREVLKYDPPVGNIAKEAKKGNKATVVHRKMNAKQEKLAKVENQMAAYDAVLQQIYGPM